MSGRRWHYAAMAGCWVGYAVLLAARPAWLPDVVVRWLLGSVVYLLPMALLLDSARRDAGRRSWAVPLALAVGAFAVGGSLIYASGTTGSAAGTAANLAVYPLLLLALLMALRGRLPRTRLIVTLDGLAGALSAAAVAACVVAPMVGRLWASSASGTFAVVFCFGDIVLLALVFGALGLVGRHDRRAFGLWTVGLTAFAVADVAYTHQLAFGGYRPGTWTDSLWALGFLVMAVGADLVTGTSPRRLPRAGSLIVVGLSSGAAVVALATAPAWRDAPTPTLLALAALAACGVRLLLAFSQLRELTDVREQAMTDELTGIANRRALYAALDAHLTGAEPMQPCRPFALALVDLDHFKEVNDSFGHAAGDELLRVVVQRFKAALTQLQTPHLLARLGGDEFAVLMHDVGSRDAAGLCGVALQDSLTEPVVVDDVVLHVRASIGMALAPEHAESRGDMLFAADAAMYASKTSAEPVCFYSPTSVGDRRKRLEVAEDLYAALERGELTVEYQPITAADGALVGAEALVRWDHPTRGRLSPAEFLEVAERYRLTPSIAVRVLDVALADLRRWRGEGKAMRLSVNVSASDLRDEALVDIVASALLKHGIPPSALTIEITETAMMSDPAMASAVMHALDELGVQLAVDDYGTGYSSLEYLLKLPINEIKLDRAFSSHLVDELRSVAIVRSTIDLTHALGLRMVAEGVEDVHTLGILQDLGCDLVQGWHVGRPMSAVGFEEWLAQRQASPAPLAPPGIELAS